MRHPLAITMQPTRRQKLTAQAEHLLDVFLGLRGKYAMLEPMLFDQDTINRWGTRKRVRGFHIIANTILMSCVLDVAKITLDKDDRTPSLSRLEDALSENGLTDELREEFAVRHVVPTAGDDPDVIAILHEAERREEGERRQHFDASIAELRARWLSLRDSPSLQSFGTMRDQLIAHAQLHHDGSQYRPLDISSLGLRHTDLKAVIADLERLVELVSLVFRSASFDFNMLDEQLDATRGAFWAPAL
jgi:hypothetical protein